MSQATAEGELRGDQWEKLVAFIPGDRKGKAGPRSNNRCFFNALLWIACSGVRWSDSIECFGKYEVLKRRYYRFIERGVFDAMFAATSDDADLEWRRLASTTFGAHQHAAGARKVKGGLMPRVWADLAAA